jgi:hypothetical protein
VHEAFEDAPALRRGDLVELQAVKPRPSSAIAATGAESVLPITSKPGGISTTLSPWLIQTSNSGRP